MPINDVREFFEDERDTIEDFMNGPINGRIRDAQREGNQFKVQMWTAWRDYCEDIMDLNDDMLSLNAQKLCRALAVENAALEIAINNLANDIMNGPASRAAKRQLNHIRRSLCISYAANGRIRSNIPCADPDNTNPNCGPIRY